MSTRTGKQAYSTHGQSLGLYICISVEIDQRADTGHTERLVSLYLTLMSAAVSRIASIASSNVTLYTPSLAIDSCAAVTALTA